MALIESEEAALRLARAIVADICLYHAEDIASGVGVSEAVAEGRDLFRSRVAPHLHATFEVEVAAKKLATGSPETTLAPLETNAPREPLPTGMFQGLDAAPASGGSGVVWLLIAVLAIAAGVGWFLAVGR